MKSIPLLLLLPLFLASALAESPDPTVGSFVQDIGSPGTFAQFRTAVAIAGATSRPILVFARPENCNAVRPRACAEFQAFISHPAMCRRLEHVVFLETAAPRGDRNGSLLAFDPGGQPLARWVGIPDLERFSKVLSLVENAAPHLADAYRASLEHQTAQAEHESALALLSLGQAARARTKIEAMQTSSTEENRQLARLWLMQLDASQTKTELPIEALTTLANSGATDQVRFEAWMAVGNTLRGQDRYDEAIQAYRQAVAAAPSLAEESARNAMWQIEELSSTIPGLGGPFALVAGRRTLQPGLSDPRIAKVEFRLDDRLVATSTRPPFPAAISFGAVPKRQILDIVARDRAGRVLHHQNVVVNPQSDELSVRIAEPSATTLSGRVGVEVLVRVPRGRRADSVVVEWNGAPVARLVQAPYRTVIDVGPGQQGILRAVLRLDDGSEVEDAMLANSGSMSMKSDVNLVEVPVYFDEKGVKSSDLIVREGGSARTVDRLVPAEEAPLRIAFALDSSKSMLPHLLDVEEAALRFMERNLVARDRVMLVAFSHSIRAFGPTGDREAIERSILSMQAEGATSLHDAMIMALLQIPSSGTRRALVVFSDGQDTSSIFDRRVVETVARRSGVPIYVLSLEPPSPNAPSPVGRAAVLEPTGRELMVRSQRELAVLSRVTGGRAFELRSLDQLESIWATIGEDLKKQSLVIYQTRPAGSEWRTLDISLKNRGDVRAPAGVFVSSGASEEEVLP
ncbi:MAG: VWA domain-containing protein [Acidobacteriota bacterium]